MRQYCRYCANFVTGNGDWCEELKKEVGESAARRPNKCRVFEFNEIDAFDLNRTYKPRGEGMRQSKTSEQPTLFDGFFG